MGAPLAILGLLVIAGIVAWILISTGVFSKSVEEGDSLGDDLGPQSDRPAELLRYHVPEGQDPAAVVAALTHSGYETELDGARVVVVARPEGRTRDEIRATISAADTAIDAGRPVHADIHFEDERKA